MDKLYHRTADSTDTPNSVDEMSGSKQEYKSNQAADKALKRMSVNLVKQLNLFDTVLNLHAMDGLTALEMEELTSFYKTELERKQYLVITVIPSKGQYKGMKLLMQALRQTEQYEVLSLLEKTYDEEVDAIIDNVGSIASPVEEQPQPQSGDVFSLKSSVTVEQQLQSQSDDVSPFESPEQQPHSQSDGVSSLAFPVIAEQPQSQSNSSASLNSPTQQQSQSQITPYFKFRLPPTYSGTVTFAVSPSSQSSTDDIPHSSNANGGDPPEQDRALNATPDHENFNNNNSDHDGAASNVTVIIYLCCSVYLSI